MGAILANKVDKQEGDLTKAATDRQTQALAQFLRGASGMPDTAQGQPTATAAAPMPSPQISNTPGSGPQMPVGGSPAPMPQQAQPSMMPAPQPPQQRPNPMQALLNTNSLPMMQQFGPAMLQRQQEDEDKQMTPLSAQEVDQLGFRKGTVAYRDHFGGVHVAQESDLKSPEAIAQGRADQQFTNQLPPTPYQRAELGNQSAQLNKPVSVGFGESLVNPQSGKVVFQGQADPTAIDQMVDWSIAHGGAYPPNARSPAIAAAFNAAMHQRLQQTGQTNDQLVDKGIGLRARGGAAYQTGKQQAGTQINEDTVSGSMNILNGLLKQGAAGPSSITGINDLAVWARQHTNDPNAANLVNAISTISNEYARVMTGNTGSGGSSDAARNEAAQRILKGYNAGTMQQVMGQMHYDMRQRTTAQTGALNQLTGGQYGGVKPSINYADPNAPQGGKTVRYQDLP